MKTERLEMRIDEDLLGELDKWCESQITEPTRSQAARALIKLGLDVAKKGKPKK